MDFTGDRVLVTGGSRGIGRACALGFAQRGARVAVNYHENAAAAEKTLADLTGDGHVAIQADITDPEAVEALVTSTIDSLGGLDIVVNNAGIWVEHLIEDVINSIFGINKGYGALGAVADSEDLFIFSRTYNEADTGTFGTAVPGVAENDLIEGNTRKRLLYFTQDDFFRSNLAFQNGTASYLTVKWEHYLADGTLSKSGETELKPWGNKQLNAVFKYAAPVEAAYIDFWTETPGGKFMVFSSVVDNGTSDGTVVQPQW